MSRARTEINYAVWLGLHYRARFGKKESTNNCNCVKFDSFARFVQTFYGCEHLKCSMTQNVALVMGIFPCLETNIERMLYLLFLTHFFLSLVLRKFSPVCMRLKRLLLMSYRSHVIGVKKIETGQKE